MHEDQIQGAMVDGKPTTRLHLVDGRVRVPSNALQPSMPGLDPMNRHHAK